MKYVMKKFAALALCTLLCIAFAARSASENDSISPNADKLFYGKLVYNTVSTENGGAETTYPTVYTLERKNDEIMISRSEDRKEQSIQSDSVLYANGTNGKTPNETPIPRAFMPKKITMSLKNTQNSKANVDISAEHSLENQEIRLTITQFLNETDSKPDTKNYTMTSSAQYYDEASFLWMISTLPLKVGYSKNITVSSINRDQLQSKNISVKEETKYTVNKGSENEKTFDCYVVAVTPAIPFTDFTTHIYYAKDHHHMIVAVKQADTKLELTSYAQSDAAAAPGTSVPAVLYIVIAAVIAAAAVITLIVTLKKKKLE